MLVDWLTEKTICLRQKMIKVFSSCVDQSNIFHHRGCPPGSQGPGHSPGESEGGPGSWRQPLWEAGPRHPGYWQTGRHEAPGAVLHWPEHPDQHAQCLHHLPHHPHTVQDVIRLCDKRIDRKTQETRALSKWCLMVDSHRYIYISTHLLQSRHSQ